MLRRCRDFAAAYFRVIYFTPLLLTPPCRSYVHASQWLRYDIRCLIRHAPRRYMSFFATICRFDEPHYLMILLFLPLCCLMLDAYALCWRDIDALSNNIDVDHRWPSVIASR